MDRKILETARNKADKLYQHFDRRLKSSKNIVKDKKTLSVILSIWIFTIGFYFALFSGIAYFSGKLGNMDLKVAKSEYSLYKPGMEIINHLRGSEQIKYIQRLYVHPKDENKMMIMIKPNYWGAITQTEKKAIISGVMNEWQKIYRNSEPEKELKPEAHFANM